MDLTDLDIKEFKSLYRERFDIELNDSIARSKLSILIQQMQAVFKPITQDQFDSYLNEYVNEVSRNDQVKEHISR